MGLPNQQQQAQKSDKGQLIDTQASCAIPLALGIVNDDHKPFAIRYLNAKIKMMRVSSVRPVR